MTFVKMLECVSVPQINTTLKISHAFQLHLMLVYKKAPGGHANEAVILH